jgi:endonuclease I
MRTLLSFLALCFVYSSFAQVPAYYSSVNLSATGQSLKNNLASKVISSQNQTVSYTPGVWNALRQTDLAANSTSKVVLIYGYNDSDGNASTDRTRSIYSNGGGSTDWNREHVYPKSLGTPTFGNSGPGSDPHQVRASDVSRNASRGNRKFASGSGNSAITSQGNWYPGDEFKGDVARIILYMYVRYGTRCLPKNVGVGNTVSNDQNMVELFLQWNAEDPVSSLETQRNDIVENLIGSRNPFIDNPAFATQIWGGQQAEDRFGNGNGNNPPTTTTVTLKLTFDDYPEETSWEITNSSNQIVHSGINYGSQADGSTVSITETLADGCYNLIVKDSYGDGMCCNYGNGSFLFTNNSTGNTITSGGSFQALKTKAFCLGTSARLAQNDNTNATTLDAFTETSTGLELSIYPNPAREFIQVESTTKQALNYTISSLIGQTLANGTINNQQIGVQELPKGVYILSINNGVQTYTKKFIKG